MNICPLIKKTLYILGAFGGHDKYNDRMLLSEVSALTLYHGKMTNARRSSPVPQVNVTTCALDF